MGKIDPNITILLVEDAGLMRKLEMKALGSLQFTNVIEAEDGDDAINKLQSSDKIDLIISDWNMPNKSGYDLLLWVRDNEIFKETPFLMATGRGEKKEVAKATEAGVSAFISKPFNPQELQAKIEEAFGFKEEETKERRKPTITESGKVLLKIAHIQITDHLALGVLKHLIKQGEVTPHYFELETECMPGWNPVADALEKGDIDGAFVLAPLAMDLFNYGAPLKLVLFAHKSGSIFVRNKKGAYQEPFQNFFRSKSFYIPHTMSIHNMLSHMFFKGIGLKPGVTGQEGVDIETEVVAPIKMPEFLAGNEKAAGYLVAEPLGTKAIAMGVAEKQLLSSELWENHPCCVVAMQDDVIEQYTDAIFEFTKLLVKAGEYIAEKPGIAAEIGVNFLDPNKNLGLKVQILENVLNDPKGIKTQDMLPVKNDLDKIQHYMHDNMQIGGLIDLDSFVDMRFATEACKDSPYDRLESNIHETSQESLEILKRGSVKDEEQKTKELLNKEGEYLCFEVGNHRFGIEVLKIIEISQMMKLRSTPDSPHFVMGVVNFRGTVIPVCDPRKLFGLKTGDYGERSLIIVMEAESLEGSLLLGMAADTVSGIENIKAKDIDETSTFLTRHHGNYISAMARLEDGVTILLDVNLLFNQERTVALSSLLGKVS